MYNEEVPTQMEEINRNCVKDLNNYDVSNSVPTFESNNIIQTALQDVRTEQHLKAMEILTTNKRQLEIQLYELQDKVKDIDSKYTESVNNCNKYKQHLYSLELELKTLKDKYLLQNEDIHNKSKTIEELNAIISKLTEKNNSLSEQIDITKTALMTKEAENTSMQSLLLNLQNKLDGTELQLQQLSNGTILSSDLKSTNQNLSEENERLIQKIAHLQQQLKSVIMEKEQLNINYEQYVGQLNEQVSSLSTKNNTLMQENNILADRESSLIEQIGDMEIQLQHFRETCVPTQNVSTEINYNIEYNELQSKYLELEVGICLIRLL